MNKQPKALRLADEVEDLPVYSEKDGLTFDSVAMELRRLHEVSVELLCLVKRYQRETTLGLQPNMIDLEAKEAITKAEKQND